MSLLYFCRTTTLLTIFTRISTNPLPFHQSYSISRSSFTMTSLPYVSYTSPSAVHTLYDMPVSNHGARCRLILYKKKISTQEVKIISPSSLGGLKSPRYLELNPQGKMPLLTLPCTSHKDNYHTKDTLNPTSLTAISESDTICRYFLSHYAHHSPSFLPNDPKSNFLSRLHDMYITPLQGCLYKHRPPFSSFSDRKDALNELMKQLKVLDTIIDLYTPEDGIYLCGKEVSLADATIFPTLIFVKTMLPNFEGYDKDTSTILCNNLHNWYNTVLSQDTHFQKIHKEITTALNSWKDHGRWDTILFSGIRDTHPETIFDQIIAKTIPTEIVKEDEKLIAFKDITPMAPAHILIIPKERMGLVRLQEATEEHVGLLGRMMLMAGEISKKKELGFGDGARIVVNDGKDGGQTVSHIHVHVLGGRYMEWPPG